MGHSFNKKKFKDKNRRPDVAPKKNPFELLESVNKNKDKIIQCVNSHQTDKAHQWLEYLRENSRNRPDLLAKSLCDISEKITDNDIILELLEEAAELNPVDSITLNSYATALGNAGAYDKAFELFEESLKLKRDNSVTLTSYGQALIRAELPNEAIENLKESLKIDPDDSIALFLYGIALQMIGKYQEAVKKFERVNLGKRPQSFINFIYLTIGHLYYALRNKQEGNRYFDLAIGNSASSDADKLRIARNILAARPYDEQAVNLLKEIIKTSPSYKQALKVLSLNSDAKGLFELHKEKMTSENSLQDTASLNRALYHKIQNEIAILKEILHEIITDTNTQDETLLSVQKRIHIILEEIRRRRNIEAAEVHNIPMDDYEAILLIVSKTAHDIVDFVGNEIATIKEYIWDKFRSYALGF